MDPFMVTTSPELQKEHQNLQYAPLVLTFYSDDLFNKYSEFVSYQV